MPARRFFIEGARATGDTVEIHGSDAHKIVHVLRLRDGDAIEAVDSAASVFEAALRIEGSRVLAALGRMLDAPSGEPRIHVDLAQGLPKGQKMDFIVEKATELGAASIVPFTSERAIARETGAAKIERWRRLALAAAQQSGRRDVPGVAAVQSFHELLSSFDRYDRVVFAWELAPPDALRATLPPLLEGAARILIVIGPEGGFSHGEADAATSAGATLLHLGRRVLRTETAGLMLLAVIGYLEAV